MKLALTLAIFLGLMFAVGVPAQDQSIRLRDAHRHVWADLRMLLVTVTEIDGITVNWTHTTAQETKRGHWQAGATLVVHKKGLRTIKLGKDYIGIYCGQCNVAIWLYESEK